MKLSRKLASTLHVASIFALGAVLVPLLATAAGAQTISQTGDETGTTTVALSSSFSFQIETAGGDGQPLVFTASGPSSPAGLFVSSGGVISSGDTTLDTGTYTLTGSVDDDVPADTGPWTYALTVSATTLNQTSATSGSTTPAASSTFSANLTASGGTGVVTFSASGASTPPGLSVSDGVVSSGGATLNSDSYSITGTDSDIYGDDGSWTYTLTVAIAQTSPFSGTVAAGSPFNGQLNSDGGVGTVSYSQVSGSDDITVSSSGAIFASDTLPAGTYIASGTDSDTDVPANTGTWTYTLTVAIAQTSPFSGTVAAGSPFNGQLNSDGGAGTVSYSQESGSDDITVSSSGAIFASDTLPAGTYIASGTDSDTDVPANTGTWTFTLTVNIAQASPLSGSTTPDASGMFTDQLKTNGTTAQVRFLASGPSSPPGLTVTIGGDVQTTGTLSLGTYTLHGTDSDVAGDVGTWTYALAVASTTIEQNPQTGSTTTTGSPTFTDQLVTSGGVTGSVDFTTTASSGPPGVSVSETGAVSTTGQLAVGVYTASGTDSDGLSYGDTGHWSYTLDVTGVTIEQGSPTGNGPMVTPAGSAGWTDELDTSGGIEGVTFVVTSIPTSTALAVSSSGAVSTTGQLAVGSYSISGTDADAYGDIGTWNYTLIVSPATLVQSAPQTNSVAPSASASFKTQLNTQNNVGALSFVTFSTSGPTGATTGIVVSSSGVVSATGTLELGTYRASGSDTDAYGDTGAWSFTLTVSASAITQLGPFANSKVLTPATSSSFTDQLKTTTSKVTFTVTASSPTGLVVSASGRVSTKGALAAGTYTVSGTDSDGLGDHGSWGFSATVTPTKITQAAPASAKTSTGKVFAGQLKVSDSYGTVTFAQTSGKPYLTVSSKGVVSAVGDLRAGTYRATGSASDNYRDDRGNWTFSLTVTATKITQAIPTTAATTTGKTFSTRLKLSGSHGTVTFAQVSGAPHLKISSSGTLSAPSNLPKGTYKATGDDSDSLGDTGTWSFSLTVTSASIRQLGLRAQSTPAGTAFRGQLKVTGSHGTVTYSQSTGAPHIKVSSSGVISAAANLPTGVYRATGAARDSEDDSGVWTFTLTVTARKLTQLAPSTDTTTVGKAFSDQLKLSGSHGRVTYSQSSGAPQLKVSSSGAISAPATLAAGTYKATGSARDSFGDSGSWSFTLKVDGNQLLQLAPNAGTTKGGKAFRAQLKVSGAHGALRYSQLRGAPRVVVSPSGVLTAPATLRGGVYKASGQVEDGLGDLGTWVFTLTVAGKKLTQVAPLVASTGPGTAFSAKLKVSGAHGKVIYKQLKGAPRLKVSASGAISAGAKLPAGTYKASGTDTDSSGDTGTWSFTLKVTSAQIKQIAPTAGRSTSGRAFTAQLKVSGAQAGVTFTLSTGQRDFTVSPSGLLSAPGSLVPGTYTATGTARDTAGATCSWTFTLFVAAA
ncbi:MAG: hypothetical protein ABSG36_00795 [Acidimicrobiales bacterium]